MTTCHKHDLTRLLAARELMAPHCNTAVCDVLLFAAPALPALPQVAYKYGVDTHNLLKEAGADITFKTYNGMAHSVSGGGIWFL